MNIRTVVLAASLAIGFIASASNATPVMWTLEDMTFDDGATASGHFTFDADTGTLGNIDITTSSTSTFSGAHYLFPDAILSVLFADNPIFITLGSGDKTGTPVLILPLLAPMTNAGGIIDFELGQKAEGTCADAPCVIATAKRKVASGFISGTDVPEPATASIFFVALLGAAASAGARRATGTPAR